MVIASQHIFNGFNDCLIYGIVNDEFQFSPSDASAKSPRDSLKNNLHQVVLAATPMAVCLVIRLG